MSALQRIRVARPWHVPGVLALIQELAEFEHLTHELALDAGRLHDALFGVQHCVEALVAEGETPQAPLLGYALCFRSFSTFRTAPGLYLEDLYVSPSARGQGLGVALLRQVCAQAVARGYARVEWSVLDWNQPAIDFYRRLGAQAQPEWQRFRLDGEALALAGDTQPQRDG